MADQGIEILIIQGSDLRLGILPIQCLFSKLRWSYAPFWQKVITVIVALFPKLKLNRTLRGGDSGVQICCTVKYRLYSASLTFPEFQRVDSNNCQSEKGRNTETEGKQSNGGTALRWVLVPTQRNMHTMSFEFFYRTGAPTQVEDGNFRINIRFLKHSSVAWPPANHPSGASCFWGPVMSILLGLLFGPCLFYLWEVPTVSN